MRDVVKRTKLTENCSKKTIKKYVDEVIQELTLDELGMPETLWCCKVKEFGPLIVSIDANGDNLFEQNKVTFNERKEEAKKAIYPNVKFIK